MYADRYQSIILSIKDMEDMNFEMFTGQKGKYNVNVSISKPGVLSFTSGAYSRYGLQKYKGAQLFYEKGADIIAVKFTETDIENMSTLKHRKDNKGGYIGCKSFIYAYKIDRFFGKRYVPKEMDHSVLGKIFIINLNEEG